MSTMSKLFIAHPAAVGESYFEHMKFAFKFSGGCSGQVLPLSPMALCRRSARPRHRKQSLR